MDNDSGDPDESVINNGELFVLSSFNQKILKVAFSLKFNFSGQQKVWLDTKNYEMIWNDKNSIPQNKFRLRL